MVAAAIVGSAVIGGAVASNSASNAADEQSEANDRALSQADKHKQQDREDALFYFNAQMAGDEEMDRRNRADKEQSYQRGVTLNKTAVDNGEVAGNQLSYLMGLGDKGTGEKGWLSRQFTEADMTKDGGYDFRMGEGQKSVGNQFAASGNLLSGAAMKALTRFNQDFASNEYNNAYGRFNNDQATQYNRLSGIQGAGQNAVNSIAGLGGTVMGQASNAPTQFAQMNQQSNAAYGNALANYNANQGNINANLAMARGQAFNQGLTGLNNAWNTYQTQKPTSTWTNTNNGQYWTNNGNTYSNSGGYDYVDF